VIKMCVDAIRRVFFFSSRRRHTRLSRDWSSDVCSSDLMRFLTAYYATQEHQEVVLTGSQRMQERPIHILVDALRSLGADISYQNQEGFPPLLIKGKKLHSQKLQISANISSQYISALLLIAPKLENGLQLELIGECTS